MTRADDRAPMRIDHCCHLGVAPTRYPVLRSCEVVPPLEAAMQTTAAMEIAVSLSSGSVQPRAKKIRHVSSSVATVMPEMGLDDEPISPVRRDDTVTNKNPNSTISTAPSGCIFKSGTQENSGILCNGEVAQIAATRSRPPTPTIHKGRSRSVRRPL